LKRRTRTLERLVHSERLERTKGDYAPNIRTWLKGHAKRRRLWGTEGGKEGGERGINWEEWQIREIGRTEMD
jgi:hypothetical protein